jgi:hypothetical protein
VTRAATMVGMTSSAPASDILVRDPNYFRRMRSNVFSEPEIEQPQRQRTVPIQAEGGAPGVVLEPGGVRLHLDVVHEPAKRLRPTSASRLEARLRRMLDRREAEAGAVFEGAGGRNCVLLAAIPATSPSADPDLTYHTEVVDHRHGDPRSVVDREGGLFHFVNVFQVASGRRDQMIEYFEHTIPAVRVQPGYVSTNLIVNESGTRAVNIGQYERREDFLAIFRQVPVLRAFAAGPSYKVMPAVLGLLPRLPRLRLYGVPRTVLD